MSWARSAHSSKSRDDNQRIASWRSLPPPRNASYRAWYTTIRQSFRGPGSSKRVHPDFRTRVRLVEAAVDVLLMDLTVVDDYLALEAVVYEAGV